MRIRILPALELSDEHIRTWANIQLHTSDLASPYFRPEYTKAVATVRNDVFVGVVDDGAAFFPFQRAALGRGRPVGGAICDYHGLIAPAGHNYDIAAIVRECGLATWRFENVPASQLAFESWQSSQANALIIDVQSLGELWSSTSRAKLNRKRRKLQDELGQIEVEIDSGDIAMLDLCMNWKSRHYRRMGVFDLFKMAWARDVLHRIAAYRSPDFAGVLSVLRAGGRPVALHFGMRSRSVWHHWFPTYDPEFSRYSPGIILLTEMIEAAPALQVDFIDFGRGEYDYKLRVANARIPLLSGCVTANGTLFWMYRNAERFKNWVKESDLLPGQIAQIVRDFRSQTRFR